MGDKDAIKACKLDQLIENLPGRFFVGGDCAYPTTNKLVAVVGGPDALTPRYDNFNYFLSQLRIRIEMAFGLMVKKWGILQRPIDIAPANWGWLIGAIGKLHNFCINERLSKNPNSSFRQDEVELDAMTQAIRVLAAEAEYEDMGLAVGFSECREEMVNNIQRMGLTRPSRNRINRSS